MQTTPGNGREESQMVHDDDDMNWKWGIQRQHEDDSRSWKWEFEGNMEMTSLKLEMGN